jgi:hypothetical protein
MTEARATNVWNVALPWSDGAMSAKMWIKGKRVVVDVPELDIACTGKTQSEAVFRLFSNLLKYYQELKANPSLDERQQEHMRLLKVWVESVERKMSNREMSPLRR